MSRTVFAALAAALFAGSAAAQTEPAAPADQGSSNKVVVTVNGQPIYEKVLQRRLRQIPPAQHDKARPELVKHFVEEALVDQYLKAMKITVEEAVIEQKIVEFKETAEKAGQKYEDFLKAFMMTDAEFKEEITNLLRWDKFVDQQAPEDKLRAFHEQNKIMFDGTAVRARHILLPADAGSEAKLKQIKAEVIAAGKAAADKVPADAVDLERESTRTSAMDAAFSKAAREHSECPSKQDGGDLRWFPRVGAMDETFSAAAFSLKAFELSEPIETPFGRHLIMVIDRRTGLDDVKFEDVKRNVRDIYGERLKDAVIEQMKPRSKIVYTEAN